MLSFLTIILRKMIKNKWLVLSLLAGMTIGTALLSCMPAYTNAVLQKMLLKEIRNYQNDNNVYPGGLFTQVDTGSYNVKSCKAALDILERYNEDAADSIPLPLIAKSKLVSTVNFTLAMPKKDYTLGYKPVGFNLSAYFGLEDHIRIIDGRMPSSGASAESGAENIYEGLVTEEALNRLDFIVGKEYVIKHDLAEENTKPYKIKIIGVFEPKSTDDPYWFYQLSQHKDDIFINYDLMVSDFVDKDMLTASRVEFYQRFDYNFIKLDNIDRVLQPFNKEVHGSELLKKNLVHYKFPIKDIAEKFFVKRQQITTQMLSMNVSILVMLALFLLMVSLLKIEREKTEISVLISRGAGRMQVTLTYAAEGLILAICSLIFGPPLGLLLCKIIGASNGFLQFVDRAPLDASLNNTSYFYACLGMLFSVFVLAAPAYISSGASVVTRKQNIARRIKNPFWQVVFLDIILFAISGYGYYMFDGRQRDLLSTGLTAESLETDPLLFIAPAIFVIAAGLFFLRIFPVIVSLVYRAGRRLFPPAVYAVLLQASRSAAQYHFLMLFISFTVALGLFSADAARTINLNSEEKIRYSIAADVVIKPVWARQSSSDASPGMNAFGMNMNLSSGEGEYVEPDFRNFEKSAGVEIATKVYSTDDCSFTANNKDYNARLMAINTEEFGRICWFRPDLLLHHWYQYLNLIAREPASVLISGSLAQAASLKPGDAINIIWGESGRASVHIFGIVDYWPSWNPNAEVKTVWENGESRTISQPDPMLIVGNFDYILDNMLLEPYDIWLKMKPGAKTAELYADLEKNNNSISEITNMKEELVKLKNDPLKLGVNGALTLGFIISLIVCLIGFILYWTLSIRARELQFGIFRAIGIHLRQILGMLAWEQVLTSGTAILAGILIGRAASKLFIPFFQMSYSSYEQVPPFRIIYNTGDHVKLYIIVAAMLVIGFVFLWSLVSRIKTAQALKLGED